MQKFRETHLRWELGRFSKTPGTSEGEAMHRRLGTESRRYHLSAFNSAAHQRRPVASAFSTWGFTLQQPHRVRIYIPNYRYL
jgi:hypothetical protein